MRTRLLTAALLALAALGCASRLTAAERPNVFLAIADDWGYPHAGAYGDPVVKTPTFDRVAREGVLFTHAFVSSPSCTPSRAALLTGQFHWRLEESANLWSTLQAKFKTYPGATARRGLRRRPQPQGVGAGPARRRAAAARTRPGRRSRTSAHS